MFLVRTGCESDDVFYVVDIQSEVTRMTDAERDAIHEHILQLKNTDRRLSESLLNAMQEREMLLRWMQHANGNPLRETCHDFSDELMTIQ
jgi:hypothetical protein